MSTTLNLAPCDSVEIHRLAAKRGDDVPNNERYPALILSDVLSGETDPAEIHALYAENGWGGAWTWQVFDYHHFHPDAFEVLAVAKGSATLMLGGPQGQEVEVSAGDVIILPPGYGHKQIEKRDGFTVCGGYPPGQDNFSTIRASEGYDDRVLATIRDVAPPDVDPLYGQPFSRLVSMKDT